MPNMDEAIRKQKAEKPILEGDGCDEDGNTFSDTWRCPNCKKEYEIDCDEYDYCPNCGQKIDRSVIESLFDEDEDKDE